MVVGRGNVINNVYIVYLSCNYLVILLYCTIVTLMKRKIRGLQGSVAHVSTLGLPLALGKHPSGCGVNPPFAVCLTCVNHTLVKFNGCGFESHFLYVFLSQLSLLPLKA